MCVKVKYPLSHGHFVMVYKIVVTTVECFNDDFNCQENQCTGHKLENDSFNYFSFNDFSFILTEI